MVNGIGFKLGSAYALNYRKRYNTGSPTYTVIADSDKDSASSLVWSNFFFGNFSNTSQGQTSISSGVVSGFVGTSSTSQAQTSVSTGTLNEFIRLDTSIDAYRKIGSVHGIKYRKSFSCGFPFGGMWNNKEWNFVWNNWFFGIGSATGQSGQTSVATGTVGGTSGTSTTSQESQSSVSAGTISGIVGISSTSQAQTSLSSGVGTDSRSGTLVIGGEVIGGVTTRVYNSLTGALLWTANHGTTVRAVAIDDSGNVYTTGLRHTDNYTTRKYNSSGDLQWSVDHGANTYGIALDTQGNIIIVGAVVSSATARKYDNNGTEITTGWPTNHGGTLYAVATDTSDNVYVTGNSVSTINTRKYSSSGSAGWTAFHSSNGNDHIAVIGNYLIHGGSRNTLQNCTSRIVQLSNGSLLYNYDHGTERVYGAAQAYDYFGSGTNNIITGGARYTSSITTRQFPHNSSTDNWNKDHGGTVYCVCSDRNNGDVYTGGSVVSSVSIRKYTTAGVAVTSNNWPLNHGGIVYGIAWSPYSRSIVPGLAIPLSLGIPTQGNFSEIPALAIPLSLGIPTPTPPPAPTALSGITQLYKLYVTGGSELIELPISSLQCRRELGASTWIDVIVPNYSNALISILTATPNRELVIYAGNSPETMGEMMRAVLTEIRDNRDYRSGTIQLKARVVPMTVPVSSYTLTGIRKRGKNEDGARTVVCEVDPRIRTNHTVFDGVNTFKVGSLSYQITTSDAFMSIKESI